MENLTNEYLKKYFLNNFDLANYAIKKVKGLKGEEEIPRLPVLLKEIAYECEEKRSAL